MKMMEYKHAIELYRLYNSDDMSEDWLDLNVQQNFNDRQENVKIVDYSQIRVGKNILTNRLSLINNKMNTFKINAKTYY